MKLSPEDIAYPRSINGLSKWKGTTELWRKSAPIHVKGGLLYNHLVEKNKLGNKYVKIQEGDKIKFLRLRCEKLQLAINQLCLSFITELPRELDMITPRPDSH